MTLFAWEFQKCANPACTRQVKASVQYCCGYCAVAHEVPFEVHEHSLPCDRRAVERGPYIDPWSP
jgi:hypothetical protein